MSWVTYVKDLNLKDHSVNPILKNLSRLEKEKNKQGLLAKYIKQGLNEKKSEKIEVIGLDNICRRACFKVEEESEKNYSKLLETIPQLLEKVCSKSLMEDYKKWCERKDESEKKYKEVLKENPDKFI